MGLTLRKDITNPMTHEQMDENLELLRDRVVRGDSSIDGYPIGLLDGALFIDENEGTKGLYYNLVDVWVKLTDVGGGGADITFDEATNTINIITGAYYG